MYRRKTTGEQWKCKALGNYIGPAEPMSTTVPTEEAQLTFEKGRQEGRERGKEAGRQEGRKKDVTQAGHVW